MKCILVMHAREVHANETLKNGGAVSKSEL
jgi:hypothetical protein